MSFLDNIFTQQSSGGGGLSSSSESDISESRGFLATLASAVTAARVAVNLDATPAANLATLAGAIATGNMKVLLQAGTAAIGKLAGNVGVNIGTVDVNAVLQLPASLGQKAKAASLSVAVASDQSVPVTDGGSPLMVIGNGGNPLPISGLVTVSNTVVANLGTSLPAGAANIGKVDIASMPALPQLPAALGQKAMAASTSFTLASDQAAVATKTDASADYDTSGGTQTISMRGIALPGSGGPVAGGTVTAPLRVEPIPGATVQPVSDGGSSLTVDGSVSVSGTVSLAAAIPAGTNAIGKLAANAGVNVGTVDVASIASGVAITGSLPTGTNTIGKLASNPDINIGNVKVDSAPQLPATLGQKTMAQSLTVAVASDQTVPVTSAQLPTSPGPKTAAGSLSVALATDQPTVNVAAAQLPSTLGTKPAGASLSVAVADEVPIRVSTLQLPSQVGSKLKTDSLSVQLATDHGAIQAQLQAGVATIGNVNVSSGSVNVILPPMPSSGFGFQTTVGVTEITLASNAVSVGAVLKADDDNTDSVYFRYATGTTTTNGFRLRPGQFVPCPVANTNLIRCISGTAAQKVHCSGA